jgi:DNA-binding MarR family transcriptional regulator
MTVLAAKENLSAPSITKIAVKLEASGLVRRETSFGDRRVSLLAATAKGDALVQEVRDRRTVYLNERLSRLTVDQMKKLKAALPILEILAADDLDGST